MSHDKGTNVCFHQKKVVNQGRSSRVDIKNQKSFIGSFRPCFSEF